MNSCIPWHGPGEVAALDRRCEEDKNCWGPLDLEDVWVDLKLKYYMYYN